MVHEKHVFKQNFLSSLFSTSSPLLLILNVVDLRFLLGVTSVTSKHMRVRAGLEETMYIRHILLPRIRDESH